MTQKYILVVGDAITGLSFYGPFDNEMEAVMWEVTHLDGRYNRLLLVPIIDHDRVDPKEETPRCPSSPADTTFGSPQ